MQSPRPDLVSPYPIAHSKGYALSHPNDQRKCLIVMASTLKDAAAESSVAVEAISVPASDSPPRSRPNTFSALGNANFRLYFVGQLVSMAGTWMQNVAQGYLVVQIVIQSARSANTSNLWLGIVACAAGLPLVLLAPVSGVIVERFPRRRIMLVTQTVQMILAFTLAVLAFANAVQIWQVVILAAILGITNAVDQPSRQTFIVEMVGRKDLTSGIQLNSTLVSASRVIGPSAAGVALVAVGAGWCFLINGLSFLAVIGSLLIMQVPYQIKNKRSEGTSALRQMREGLAYARSSPTIAPMLLLTTTIGFFVLPMIQFFAAFAATVLHSAEFGYSVIAAAQGVGSVAAGLLVGWVSFRLGRGRILLIGVLLTGVVNFLFSRETEIPLAALMAGLSGLTMVATVIMLNTLIQTTLPDHMRGRVMSLYTLSFFGVSPFGALLLGFVAGGVRPLIDLLHLPATGALADFPGVGTADGLALFAVVGVVLCGLILLRWPKVTQQE